MAMDYLNPSLNQRNITYITPQSQRPYTKLPSYVRILHENGLPLESGKIAFGEVPQIFFKG
jgi:hypothetical protein